MAMETVFNDQLDTPVGAKALTGGRFRFVLKAIKTAAVLGTSYATICLALIAYDKADIAVREGWREGLLWANEWTFGGLDLTLDHKTGKVAEVASMNRSEVEKSLYYALLQLEMQAYTMQRIREAVEMDDATGGKIINTK